MAEVTKPAPELFKPGEPVYVTGDVNKKKFTTGGYIAGLTGAGAFVQIIPVEPIMQEKLLWADQAGTPFLNAMGELAPKKVIVEDRTRILINPAKLSRFTDEKPKG